MPSDIDPGDIEDRRKERAPGFPDRPVTPGRRSMPRRRVLLSGLIVNLETGLRLQCRLENISEGGTRIRLPHASGLPAEFWLIAITARVAHRSRIVWRHDDRLGVAFIESVELDDPINRVGRKLRSFWASAT